MTSKETKSPRKGTAHALTTLAIVVVVILFLFLLAVILYREAPDQYSGATPGKILKVAPSVLTDARTLLSILNTLYLTFKGLFIGGILAVVIGIVLGLCYKWIERIIPVINAIRAIPLTLLIPFLITIPTFLVLPPWSNSDAPSRDPAYLIALGSFLYLLIGMAQGILHLDKERRLILERVHKFSRKKYLFRVVVFEALPDLLTVGRITVLFSLVLAIVLEQLTSYPGIGFLISQKMNEAANIDDEVEAEVFVLIFLVAVVGILIDFGYQQIQKIADWEDTSK